MKRNVIILSILVAILVVLLAVLFLGKPSDISAIEVSKQDNGGVTLTNYMPILKETIDWTSLSDRKRAKITRDAVNAAIQKAEQEDVKNFNVMGFTHTKDEPIFLYSGGDSVSVYVNGEPTAIPLKE